jgi:A/G-specific adenine glycosylase
MEGGPLSRVVEVVAAVIEEDGLFLLTRRLAGTHLAGMWEFPGGKIEPGETHAAALRREIREELGLEIEVGQLITTVKHAYTHFKITLHAFCCRLLEGEPRALGVADWRWVTLAEVDAFPFPRTDLKIIEVLRNKKEGSRE